MKQLLLVLTFLLLAFPATTFAADWDITSYDTHLTVQEDGKVAVTETIDVDFHRLEKHGIYRDIPYVYQDAKGAKTYTEIDVTSVKRDDKKEPYDTSRNGNNIRIKIGDEDRTISGVHRYVISYLATGVLLGYEGYDELYWNVVDASQWDANIFAASATVTLPKDGIVQYACYQGERGSTSTCPTEKKSEREISFTIPKGSSGSGQVAGLTAAVGYTKGMVPLLTVEPPRLIENEIGTWPTLVGFLVALLGGLLAVSKWWQKGKDEGDTKRTVVAEYESPEGLRPAELGVLVDERADTLDVTATIIDLAVRGFLTVKELEKKGLFGQTDYELTKTEKKTEGLLGYEKSLHSALFASGKTVKLSALKSTFYTDLAKVKEKLYAEVTAKKLFADNPEKVRNKYLLTAVGILILGFGLLIFSVIIAIGAIFGLGVGAIIIGFVGLGTAISMPKRTGHGRELYNKAQGYRLFIDTADRYRVKFDENNNLFSEVLPYAIVFGLTKKFAKAMADLGIQPTTPGWYYGIHPFSPTVFASDVDSFSKSLSTAIAYSPSNSGSGGGGFSGGGFGGGGGGSW